MALLAKANIKVVPTGVEHGTITAVIAGRKFEVTTLRRDVETDGRHAVVEFGTDWLEDAARRDFTFNAMSMTPDGALYDPFHGKRDLIDGRIRFVGEASQRVREDVLHTALVPFLRPLWQTAPGQISSPPAKARVSSPRPLGRARRHELLRLLDATNPFEHRVDDRDECYGCCPWTGPVRARPRRVMRDEDAILHRPTRFCGLLP